MIEQATPYLLGCFCRPPPEKKTIFGGCLLYLNPVACPNIAKAGAKFPIKNTYTYD